MKKIDRVILSIVVGKGDTFRNYASRRTVIRTLTPRTLDTLKSECQHAFRRTFELMCKEAKS